MGARRPFGSREGAKEKEGAKDLGSRGGAEGAEEKKKEMVGFDRLSPNGVGRMKGLSVQLLSLFPFGLLDRPPGRPGLTVVCRGHSTPVQRRSPPFFPSRLPSPSRLCVKQAEAQSDPPSGSEKRTPWAKGRSRP